MDKLNRVIYYIVYKRQKGARKWIYIKANIINIYSIIPYKYIGKV